MTTAPADVEDADLDVGISAGQKMLSAVSGSLLTSLLGRLLHFSDISEKHQICRAFC